MMPRTLGEMVAEEEDFLADDLLRMMNEEDGKPVEESQLPSLLPQGCHQKSASEL